MALLEEDLRMIIGNGETSTVEFKIAPPRPGELAERLCGMANGKGGVVIVGVEDTSLKIVGVTDVRMAIDVIMRAARQIQPVLVLDPPEPEIYDLDGKHLVVSTVPPNTGLLYQASGVCWIRRSTHTIPLSVPEILEMANDRGIVHWERLPHSNTTIADIDFERVKDYLKLRDERSHRNRRFKDIESVLIGMNCAVVTDSGEVRPTHAGLLFFSYHPQQYLPQSEVICILCSDEWGVSGYSDRRIIHGTVQELIDGAQAFLEEHIVGSENKENQINKYDYSLEAVREAIVNAIVHRDYSREGECVRIFCYSNRIEIHSPGLLLSGIHTEAMASKEVISKLRNPILANLLRDIPGYIERIGSGIKLMHWEMQRMKLPEPYFKEMNEFVVTFYKASSSSDANLMDSKLDGHFDSAGLPDQKQRIQRALRYVQENGFITNNEYRNLTGVSENTALRDLDRLVEQGTLKRLGKQRGSRYQLK